MDSDMKLTWIEWETAVVYGGMGFHAKDIESRFGIVPGESRFMKVNIVVGHYH